jgi:hypothetical protein
MEDIIKHYNRGVNVFSTGKERAWRPYLDESVAVCKISHALRESKCGLNPL